MYQNPYSGDDQGLDPTAQRRKAILSLMDQDQPSRTTQQTLASGETPEAASPPNPYAQTPATTAQAPQRPDDGRHYGNQILDLYDDPYTRRDTYGGMDPTRKAISSALISSGNPYAMAAGGIGMFDAWLHRKADSAPTDFSVQDASQIARDAYRDMFGRDATDQEISDALAGQGLKGGSHWVGQAGLEGVLGHFAANAAAERAAGGGATAASTPGAGSTTATPGDTTTPGSSAGAAASSGATAAAGGGGGMPGTLEGFDAGKFNDPNKHDTKYDFARIAATAPPTPAGLDSIWGQIQQQFPDAVRVDQDEIDFDGPGPGSAVDVIRAAGNGGEAWHFEPVGGGESGAAGEAPGSSAQTLPSTPGAAQLAAPLTNNNVLQQIMEEVQRIQRGEAPRNAMLQQMGLAS